MTPTSAPALARSVIITGASTGIGRAAATHLAAKGWTVFAGVRSADDGAALAGQAKGDLRPLILDVTKQEQVDAAIAAVAAALGNRRLTGLVNNAGIAKMGPLGLQPLKDFEAHFAVNVFGMLRMTQAALPLLGSDAAREGAPGRIVTITSVGGRIAAPFLGAYTATKHANEAMTDTLRRELNIYGIDAIAIGPGSVKTPIWDKAEKDNSSGPYDASDWAEPLQTFQEVMLNGGRTGLEPERIARVVEAALSDAGPRARYAPVPQKLTNFIIPTHLPKRLLDKIFISRFGLQRR
jgi:NAD(P)-dependent dehydrogenase (short-subunit alcohol dehydrogenase family)